MINFIIYEKDICKREMISRIIKKFLYTKDDYYKIFEYDRYNAKLQEEMSTIKGTRIFLINIDEISSNGLRFAKSIRESEDLLSPIILLTAKDMSRYIDKLDNILFLNIIDLKDDLVKRLMLVLRDAYKIITRNSVFTFSIFDEVYRIPYKDIYFIKKNANDDSVTIYTKDDSYLHYITIKGLEKLLEHDSRFYKVHRSVIVNLYNVSSYDRKNNILIFNNGLTTDLISKQNKSRLSERLKDFSNVD